VLAYISLFLIAMVLPLADPLLSTIPLFKKSSGMFTLHFWALHSLPLFIIFSHWPYEFESEESSGNPDTAEKTNVVSDLVDPNEGDSCRPPFVFISSIMITLWICGRVVMLE
jgi:hypothetical protein